MVLQLMGDSDHLTQSHEVISRADEQLTMGHLEDDGPECNTKMTYNEWRQRRKRRKLLYKAPMCQTKLQSLEVQAGYSVRLSVVVTGIPTPCVTWQLDDEEIEDSDKFTTEYDASENKYSLVITQISPSEAGTYRLLAVNCEGTDSTIGFINIKDTNRGRRRRSVSRRPLVSTIKEWQSKEEPEEDPQQERLKLRNRIHWDWSNLCALSDDENNHRHRNRDQSCDIDFRPSESKTEEEWEETRRINQISSSRCKSLPNMNESVVENKYSKLKSFWEKQMKQRA